MKKILLLKRHLLIALILFILFPSTAISTVLNVPQKYQEMDQWCWAACSEAVLAYYGMIQNQNNIAQFGTLGDNIWNYLYGGGINPTRRGVDQILNNFGEIRSISFPNSLPQVTIQDEIDAGRPIIIRWGWDGGGGHQIVAKGIQNDSVYVMDPWNGPSINSYIWVLQGGNHAWTHSLQLTTDPFLTPPQALVGLRVEDNTTLKWDPGLEDVLGYRIRYGTVPGEYVKSLDVGNSNQYTLINFNLPANVTHFFVVTAYNNAGESSFSNEVPWTAPPPPPTSPSGLRID